MGRSMRTPWRWSACLLVLLWPAAIGVAQEPLPPISPPLAAPLTDPVPLPPMLTPLTAGQAVTLRVLQVLPSDGLSPGERLLNGRRDLRVGDQFLAEVIDPPGAHLAIVGGEVTKIVRPGWFGRPGYVAVQFVQTADGATLAPWQVDLRDRRLSERARRVIITTLLAAAGAEMGTVAATQVPGGHETVLAAGAGVGVLVGLAYASLQRGTEPRLEPSDTFRVVVGTASYRPVPRDWQTILYPAPDPDSKKGHHK